MNKLRKILAASALSGIWAIPAQAQELGIKTNLLYDATASPSLGFEVGVASKWTIDVSGSLNGWDVGGHKWKHWEVQPEARYWFCERFQGNFLAVHAIGGQFNIGNIGGLKDFLGTEFSRLKDHRVQGWGVGAGIAYGHTWALAKHWNIEAEIGFGWIYTRFDEYPCSVCGNKEKENAVHNYVGPTKAALNLVYIF